VSATRRPASNNCYGFNQSKAVEEQNAQYNWLDPGFPQEDSHPVVCVTWIEAQAYTIWLTSKTGHSYRLLSEAEYEYIDRAGSTRTYFWGDTVGDQCRYANGADTAARARFPDWPTATCNDGYVFTSPVGKFQANRYGLYDTTGNVLSWTNDCWHESYSGVPTDGSPWFPSDRVCGSHVVRGSAWSSIPGSLRAAHRSTAGPASHTVGFRVARTDSAPRWQLITTWRLMFGQGAGWAVSDGILLPPATSGARVGSDHGASARAERSPEEIELVFDRNKSALYALYERALRQNPQLQGKLVLELTIAPSGDVTMCRVVASELNDMEFEEKIIARVRNFRFEARDVKPVTTTKPIEFFR
jgi:TonB family protein